MRREHVEGTLRVRVSSKMIEVCGFLNSEKTSLNEEPTRGVIEQFSTRSATRLRRYLGNTSIDYIGFITLTLPLGIKDVVDGRILKVKFDTFIKCLQRRFKDLSLVWVLEFTENGMPHFHCLCNLFVGKSMLSEMWAATWSDLMSEEMNVLMVEAGTNVKTIENYGDTVRYLSYLYKKGQKAVPELFVHVGRFWGIRGKRAVVAADTYEIPVYATNRERLFAGIGDEIRNLNEIVNSHIGESVIVDSMSDYLVYGCIYNYQYMKKGFNSISYSLREVLCDYKVGTDESDLRELMV
jgi:hypothetical protein